MKYSVVAIRDTAAQLFGQPFFVRHNAQAVRSFTDEVNRAHDENTYYKHPQDYELWQIATYDEESGTFEAKPERLTRAADVAKTNA